MAYLVDTNVLLRLYQKDSAHHDIAWKAIRKLRRSGEKISILPRNIFEFWSVATRPKPAKGLGYPTSSADRIVRRLESYFPILSDSPDLHVEWRRLVVIQSVIGRQSHDARLVAAMLMHGISNILTFNFADFRRYPEINVVDPSDVA